MHIPVLLRQAINGITESLKPNTASMILDATFGNGGYTRLLLENPNITVLALDRDNEAIARAFKLKMEIQNHNRLVPIHGTFSQIPQLLKHHFPDKEMPFLDGIVFDVGVSSNQLDDPKRGFSYKIDGPLDMRMHQSDDCISAETIVNNFSEDELVKIIQEFGQDRQARKIGRAIVLYRKKCLIKTTSQLADVIKVAVLGKNGSWLTGQRHPALRTFQALRIYINQELKELEAGLRAAEMFLKPKRRAAIVSFHSLEDRIVKKYFMPVPEGLKDEDWRFKRKWSKSDPDEDINSFGEELENQDLKSLDYSHLIPEENDAPLSPFRILSRKVIKPTKDEVLENPRARSAKLRIAERTTLVSLD